MGVNRSCILAALATGLACAGPAIAEDCLNPDALGTARTLAVDPALFSRVGTMQYAATFPLHAREVVLTFDDGPMPPMTTKVLETLRNECVKATFFLVGRNVKSSPGVARQIAGEGHTIGNHTENHHLVTLAGPHGVQELDKGFRSIADALEPAGVRAAPFFRFPGLFNTHAVEMYAKAKGVSVMSADMVADDWTGLRPEHIIARAIARLQQKGSGILLLHDVQPALALALPKLLRELKTRGYRIVHIIPAPGAGAPATPEPIIAKKQPPAPARKVATRVTPKKSEAETVAEFSVLARWRKMMEQRKGAAIAISYPGNVSGGH
jgi:peptidoglycan/xylan/chitin deacetylase (PgdA/CDA1 family)